MEDKNITQDAPSHGMPAVLASYMPSTHDVQSLDDLSEIFLVTHSRILAENNTREMDYVTKEKELCINFDQAINEMEEKCKVMRDELQNPTLRREQALHLLQYDRTIYQEEVKTRLLMLNVCLRDCRKRFIDKQEKKQGRQNHELH